MYTETMGKILGIYPVNYKASLEITTGNKWVSTANLRLKY